MELRGKGRGGKGRGERKKGKECPQDKFLATPMAYINIIITWI